MSDAPQHGVDKLLRHDARSALAVVIGNCELLRLEAYGPLTEHQTRSVEAIERNAQKVMEILESAVVAIESGTRPR